ncbi:MAG: 5-(carboxyamino)imidazole ribonucleotide synthase [Flavobacteriales bacterium]
MQSIGILGGGQLGQMFIQECINLNVQAHVLDPDPEAPCSLIASSFTVGNLTDFDTVYNFGKQHKLLTIEIENVNVQALHKLQQEGVEIYPQPEIIEMVQDKGLQKMFLQHNKIPTSAFKLVDTELEVITEIQKFPVVQKLRKGGYDGRGVHVIRHKKDLDHLLSGSSVLEVFVPFEREISVIVARNKKGQVKSFPVVDMEFNSKANLVEFLYSPSQLSKKTQQKAVHIAETISKKLKIVGVLAVEMFVTKKGEIFVNEMAPRPHNSGHHSIEGNYTSQYAQHLRAILGLPLGDTSTTTAAVMVNLLGEPGFEGPANYRNLDKVLSMPGNYVHLYGKKNTRAFRKMGHVTVVHKNLKGAMAQARKVKKLLKITT